MPEMGRTPPRFFQRRAVTLPSMPVPERISFELSSRARLDGRARTLAHFHHGVTT